MSFGSEPPSWYALQVLPKHEDLVSELLRHKGYEEYLPVYPVLKLGRKRIKARKLFPGYVFCRFNYGEVGQVLNGHGVVTTPGVVRILGGKRPISIPAEEIAAIQRVLRSRLMAEPWPFLRVGMRVEIGAGPFRGVSGIVLSNKTSHRLVLSIELLQRSVAVTIDKKWLGATVMIEQGLEATRPNLAQESAIQLE